MKQKAHLTRLEDEELMAGIRAGNERAYLQLHTDYFTPTVLFTNGFLNNLDEARSIVAETYEKVFLLRRNFKTIADLRAFMYVTSRNSAYNYLRDTSRHLGKVFLSDDMEKIVGSIQPYEKWKAENDGEMEKAELIRRLKSEMKSLTPKRQKIFELYLDGLDTREIAKKLGIKEKTVRSTKAKSLEIIRNNLKDPGLLLLLAFLTGK